MSTSTRQRLVRVDWQAQLCSATGKSHSLGLATAARAHLTHMHIMQVASTSLARRLTSALSLSLVKVSTLLSARHGMPPSTSSVFDQVVVEGRETTCFFEGLQDADGDTPRASSPGELQLHASTDWRRMQVLSAAIRGVAAWLTTYHIACVQAGREPTMWRIRALGRGFNRVECLRNRGGCPSQAILARDAVRQHQTAQM